MKYHLSHAYIAKRKRGIIIASLMYFTVSIVLAAIGVFTENYGMFIGLMFLYMAWHTYKGISGWVSHASSLTFSVEDDKLVFSGSAFENKVSLSSIKKMVVQTKKGQALSVLLFPDSGGLEKLEGIDGVKGFADEIKSIIGADKVKYAGFFHR